MVLRQRLVGCRHDRATRRPSWPGSSALCYTAVCLVTDLDAGQEPGEGVTHAEVLEVFARNVDRLRSCSRASSRRCRQTDLSLQSALDGLRCPSPLP